MFIRLFRACCMLSLMASTTGHTQTWTLQSSLAQAMETAPELKKTMAQIAARQEDAKLSTMWPDPTISFRVDNKLGKDDNSGGFDLTDVTISQAIPLSRIKYQQSVADAYLKSAQVSRSYESLLIQNRVARAFHELQFASARYALAKKHLQLADKLNANSGKNTQGLVVRYLTPLEKIRLNIIREEASQQLTNAEGKYFEAANEFARLLGVTVEDVSDIVELEAIDQVPTLEELQAMQQRHPQLSVQQELLAAAHAEIDVARSSQTIDPTVSVSRSRDTFDTGREDVYGVMFNVQIPIHDRKTAAVSKARYNASQQRIELERMKRDLQINLKRSHTHTHHMVEQAADYEKRVLQPAQRMLDLTQRGFNSGELNMLSLVDAYNTFYAARLRYLDLIYQSRTELADLRLYAGQLLQVAAVPQAVTEQGGV